MPRAWLTPDSPAPGTNRCRTIAVPDDLAFVGAVTGALLPLTQSDNWEQAGSMTPDEAAGIMSDAFESFVASDCVGIECPPPTLPDGERIWRRNPTTGNWEYLDDTGEAWVEPTGDDAIPSPDEREELTTDERKCAAATNAVNVLSLLYDDVTTSISNDLDAAQALTNFIAASVSLFVAPFWPPIAGVLASAGALWNSFYEIAGALTVNLWDEEFTHTLVCVFLENATDTSGVVTFDYQAVNRGIFEQIWETQEYVLLVSQVVYLMSVIGEQGVNWAGGTTDLAGACAGCGEWCYLDDLGAQTTTWAHIPTQLRGVRYVGVGWQGTFADSSSYKVITIERLFDPPITVESVLFHYDKSAGSGGNNVNWLQLYNDGVKVAENTGNTIGDDQEKTVTYSGEIDKIQIWMNSGNTNAGTCNAEFLIYEGTGDNPFGLSNCP